MQSLKRYDIGHFLKAVLKLENQAHDYDSIFDQLYRLLIKMNGVDMAVFYTDKDTKIINKDRSRALLRMIGESTLPFQKPFESLSNAQFGKKGRPEILCPGTDTKRRRIIMELNALEDLGYLFRIRTGTRKDNVLYGLNLEYILHAIKIFIGSNLRAKGKAMHSTAAFSNFLQAYREFSGKGEMKRYTKDALSTLFRYMAKYDQAEITNVGAWMQREVDALAARGLYLPYEE